MASADVVKLLDCSVCLNIYTDPVNLKCGHNFCRVCIDRVLDTQEGSGVYSCPECREEYRERPALHKNLILRNLVEDFLSSQPEQEKVVVLCTYCVDSSVAAVKSCLLCEASLCENHLRVHSKTPEHVLSHLTTSPEKRKCPIHKKVLEYYCTKDSACICASCKQDVEHRGHRVETLQSAAESKKNNLKYVLENLMKKREDTAQRIQSLQQSKREAQVKAGDTIKKVKTLSRDITRQVEDLEKRAQSEIPQKTERYLLSLSDLIQKLEAMMAEIIRKMRHFEELCGTADPLTVLQDSETGDLCDPEEGDHEGRERDEGGGDPDVTEILYVLSTLSDLTAGSKRGIYIAEATQILLNENTANNYLTISADMKMASGSATSQNRPKSAQRFQDVPQVLSTQGFSSGQHYWEADVGESKRWKVGVCYSSISRTGMEARIGNCKSWCLEKEWGNQYSVIYDNKRTKLPDVRFIHRVRVYVNFKAGQVSFYHLSHPIRHLYTFTTTFTEPLYAALAVCDDSGCIKL